MSEGRFYFVQMTDPNLGAETGRHTARVVDQINRTPVDLVCIVHTDQASRVHAVNGTSDQTRAPLLRRFKAPVHFVPAQQRVLSRAEYEGVVFLFVDAALPDDSSENSARALKAVEDELRAADGKPVLLFAHAATSQSATNAGGPGVWPTRSTRQAWEVLLNSHNVKAVIASHANRNSHDWVGRIPLYVSALSENIRGRQSTYRLFEYSCGRVGYWTIYVDAPKLLLDRIFDRARKYSERLKRW